MILVVSASSSEAWGYRYDYEISNIKKIVWGYFFVELMHAITEYNKLLASRMRTRRKE